MGRHRGGFSQRSSAGRVDPLHNSVLERNPVAKQNMQANVFTLGKARGGFSQSSARVDHPRNSPPTNGIRQINSQGEAQNVQHLVPRTQTNGTPSRCSQRRLGIAATPLSLPVNRRTCPNTPKVQNHVRRSLIPQDKDNVSSAMRNKESLHDRRQQPHNANEDAQSTTPISNTRRSLSNRSRCNSPHPFTENLERRSGRNPSTGASNSQDHINQEDEATTMKSRKTRGSTCLPEMSRRKKYGESKPILVVTPNKKVVGLKHKEFSLAIGMWVRQRENIPLTVELFKDVDSEYVDRVVQLARDHYTFKPDNEFTTDVIKERIRDRYSGFRTELSNYYQKTCNSDYDRALATPHKKITNREDWEFLCDHFRSDEFQKRSAQGRKARSQQVLPHSNGPISFSQTLHERVLNGEPTDPVTMFEVTHNFKKCRDTTKCDDIKGKMRAMKEQVERGELEMSLEEVYQMNLPSTSTSSRKRRRGSDSMDYFSKTEEQLAAIQKNLDEANSARENQEKEIKRLKQKLEKERSNMKLFLNEFLESVGRDPLAANAFDSEDEEETEKEDGSLLRAEDMHREDGDDDVHGNRAGADHNLEDDRDMDDDDDVHGNRAGVDDNLEDDSDMDDGMYSDDEHHD